MNINLGDRFNESMALPGESDAKRVLDATFIGMVKGIAIVNGDDDLIDLIKQREALINKINKDSCLRQEST